MSPFEIVCIAVRLSQPHVLSDQVTQAQWNQFWAILHLYHIQECRVDCETAKGLTVCIIIHLMLFVWKQILCQQS